ncbi:MAG: MmgE/PrpD family protein [Actinobacteria bacterium]|nr:MmgE/PrpD family protein [Actinomycetota bacterium]
MRSSSDFQPSASLDLGPLVEAAASLDLGQVPASTRHHAVLVVADTIGAMLGGGSEPEFAALVERRDEAALFPVHPGPAQLVTPGQPGTDAITAAFVNAAAGTVLELDEGVRPSGHPGVHVIPAALAAAQALGRSGGELLGAVLSGYEVTARLFSAFRLRFPVHPHGNLGAIGAAVAVARLRRADPVTPAKIATALPLLSVWQPAFEGATVRNVYSGVGAATGVKANWLASAGFSGSDEALPTAFGEIAGELVDPDRLTAPVRAEDLLIAHDYQKRHSACANSHTAIDAVLSLGPLDHRQVRGVKVETTTNNLRLDRLSRGTALSNRFSLQYAVATAIVNGEAGPDAIATDPRAEELSRLVTVTAAAELTERWPTASPARVTIDLGDRTVQAEVDNPVGHESHRFTEPELRAKYEALAAAADGSGARVPYDRLLELESIADVGGLLAP